MKMTIEDFISEYEYAATQSDVELDDDGLKELYSMVEHMFDYNCGKVPAFELIESGKRIKLL